MKVDPKTENTAVRLCSFNINGLNTLFNYHPWSNLKTLDAAFDHLGCDIIALQELKLSKVTSSAIAKYFKSFITIPRAKKGYSGVGVYVRQVENNDFLKQVLTVIKAEEGLTGALPLPSNRQVSYREAPAEYADEVIGGYPSTFNDPALDAEGRCIILELNYNIVIISLYCPANSMGTEEMEIYRMNFLSCLIERCRNLIALGKQVIVVGDINVSRDMIDSDEYIKEGIKLDAIKKVVNIDDGHSPAEVGVMFEKLNRDEMMKFRTLTLPKGLVNSVIIDPYIAENFEEEVEQKEPIFVDVLRKSQGRRLKMYTCWNTLKNYRPINSGSRIDHIWATPKLTVTCHGDIMSALMGSDHCPIYCDFDLKSYVENYEGPIAQQAKKLKFEASNFYGVDNGGNSIDKFFGREASRTTSLKRSHPSHTTPSADLSKQKHVYVSRKKSKTDSSQLGISDFFFKPTTAPQIQEQKELTSSTSQSSIASMDVFASLVSSGVSGSPNCSHGEPAALRTSMKPATKGKKFWCCARSATGETFAIKGDNEEQRCNFFKWASKD